jgi:3-deoxy-D-manno-octulosonic-acid transferase
MSDIVLRFYAWLMWAMQPFLRLKLARRARKEQGYAECVEERFGRYTHAPESAPELVWVHAVSLGETRTAAILLKALRAEYPNLRILLTHGTATGRAEGASLVMPGDVQVWQPWDSPASVARFFDHFRPRLGLLMETEVWPSAMAEAQARKIPVLLVNGRLSDKSLQQALRMSPLAYPAYAALTAVYAQTQDDARRFRQMGADVAGVFGNLKFDAAPSESQRARGKAWRKAVGQPVLMFASSREGEETAFFKAFGAFAQSNRARLAIESIADQAKGPNGFQRACKALVVPRHPQRFGEVHALADEFGLAVSRRSNWGDDPAMSREAMQADVWLGDSLGEMAAYYALADVALLGGSFEPLGGQNLIEAAACGCPVVMGPHTFNFTEAAELAQTDGAAIRTGNMDEAVAAALALMADRPARKAAALAGLAFAARHRGATGQTVAALAMHLEPAEAGKVQLTPA